MNGLTTAGICMKWATTPVSAVPEPEPQQPADDRDDQDLGQHVGKDPARGRAQRHPGAELADPLDHRREQDVRDHDPAGDQ